MADHRAKREKFRVYAAYFPLESVDSVVKLFHSQVTDGTRPDLTLLSIVLGAVEHSLTTSDRVPVGDSEADGNRSLARFPEPIRLREVEDLYQRFSDFVKGSVDLGPFRASGKKTVRSSIELIKNVSNVIWAGLSSSYYKDRAHIQSIYSFLTGNKLDSFGVALSVVAACQLLGLDDVHLALTEEHSWVVFGEDGSHSVEVTWHGKGVEDKRGQPVTPSVTQRSWLYLSGHCVVCDRHMEVAAMVTSINPSIAASFDSPELTSLQQRLLWMLYDSGNLKKYPMAVTNIGDLEEVNPTPGRPSSELLFKEAIESAKLNYNNMHVYPYTYLGGYYYRLRRFKEALAAWAEASQVISKYNYHRDDEEVYKEFLEIANEIIPNAIRLTVESSSLLHRERSDYNKGGPVDMKSSSVRLLQDPEFCALFFKFYDGICEWEEGSSTPVLHITWATHMLTSLSKFDPNTRALVQLLDYVDESLAVDVQDAADPKDNLQSDKNGNCAKDLEALRGKRAQRKPGRPPKRASSLKTTAIEEVKLNGKNNGEEKATDEGKDKEAATAESVENKNNNQEEEREEDHIQSTIKELISRVGVTSHALDPDPTIVALGHACGESILNPDYLLGKGEPFAAKADVGDNNSENAVGSTYSNRDAAAVLLDASADAKFKSDSESMDASPRQNAETESLGCGSQKMATLFLHSTKMKEMKYLLTAKKLNANAIKLHLTAQSQVIVKHSRTGADASYGYGKPIKRLRRD